MTSPAKRPVEQLADLLGHRLGDHNRRNMESALDRVARALGVSEERAVALAGERHPVAYRELVSAATVHETYFFRHPEHFALLEALATRAAGEGRPYRSGWSVGCATGEEAYSLAIVLGRHHRTALVAGTDVAVEALEVAREARYGVHSLRDRSSGIFPELEPVATGQWRVREAVRRRVTFHELNLAQQHIAPPTPLPGQVDVIFCRNVLLYFQAARARAVIEALGQCLADGGLLLLGALEGVIRPPDGFELIPDVPACALRRATSARSAPVPAARQGPSSPPERPRANDLGEVRRAADAGELDRALALLGNPGEDPDRLRLAANLHAERGELFRAETLLRHLLLLSPDDGGALLQLALLAVRGGDSAAAGRYRSRLEQLVSGRSDDGELSPGLKVAYVRSVLDTVLGHAPSPIPKPPAKEPAQ